MIWIDKAQARCEAASKGPWRAISNGEGCDGSPLPLTCLEDAAGEYICHGWDDESAFQEPQDAEFSAAARTDLPHALACLREAMVLLGVARGQIPPPAGSPQSVTESLPSSWTAKLRSPRSGLRVRSSLGSKTTSAH